MSSGSPAASGAAQLPTFEKVDRLVCTDLGDRRIGPLYDAARTAAGEPLSLAAARRLAVLGEGDTVVMTTGSVSRTWVSAGIGENDGPPGAAALARALSLRSAVVTHLVAEETLLDGIATVFRGAGLSVVTAREAARYEARHGALAMAVMHPMATNDEEALEQSERILDEVRPRVAVAIERAGRNARGIYHNARGMDYGQGRARTDLLMEMAQRRGVPVVAVGDGGNEIGMGVVAEAVREHIPFGDRCVCGCGGGLGAVNTADALVIAACSNWGCYALMAALAVLDRKPELAHTRELEARLLETSVLAGLIDSSSGLCSDSVDGLPAEVHLAMVALLSEVVRREVFRG